MSGYAKLPPSLVDYFDAPRGYSGHFGWLCGYSASEDFLESALDRFTGLNKAARAHHGHIKLALFLDAGNRFISPLTVPGVMHCQMSAAPPLNLLHAKVAILGFKPHDEQHGWRLRLLVSTGNWTRQSLEESLDLVWCLDLSAEALHQPGEAWRQSCADFRAAQALFDEIAGWCDTSLLSLTINDQPTLSSLARREVESWLSQCRKYARGTPRLVDNRRTSLFSQLKRWLSDAERQGKRNYLAMGSGFYEGGNGSAPLVPEKIVQLLQETAALTHSAQIDLYVNPHACQAVAQRVEALQAQGITIRPPAQLRQVERTLHAKFIFSANHRSVSDMLTRGWLYLGSGNLTGPGFMQRMKPAVGNLEAGVFFCPDRLAKTPAGKQPAENTLSWLLPIQSDSDCDDLSIPLQAGEEMTERPPHYAPPISGLLWQPGARNQGLLSPPSASPITITVLDMAGVPCPEVTQGFVWQGEMPRSVSIRWQSEGVSFGADIPVMDELGRIAATPLRQLNLDEVLWQLTHFPQPPDLDVVDPEGEQAGLLPDMLQSHPDDMSLTSQPIRQVMSLIEGIAECQTRLSEDQWLYWCRSLEQTLLQASGNADLARFTDLGINPLSALKAAPFRPAFAEDDDSLPGQDYLQMLRRIETAWGVSDLYAFTETANE
ncbi:MAG: hypothetical protein QM578_13235 [Pantoea sp.]|uniref:hypothetical protein n=1 Tax=Pantoea sp. TaxID=69393 RepID=UPI0039E69076